MSDSLGDGRGNPTEAQIRLYERWAEGGTALSLIGEVQTSPSFPEKPGNLVLTENADRRSLNELASRGSGNGTLIWPQLGHAGALAHEPISAPKGPSPLNLPDLTCAGLSLNEIRKLPTSYANAAFLAQNTGFGGVAIHAGHGFLLSQFLSPLFNHRDDEYGGTINKRFRIIGDIINAIRQKVGQSFPVAIKINATDKIKGGLTAEDALEVVRLLDKTSVDLIDVSGGTYFPGAPSSSDGTSSSGPYFIDFARRAKALTSIPIMLTGGFQRREEAEAALEGGAADAIGLARSMALDPTLPGKWLTEQAGDPEFPVFAAPPAGSITAWYSMRLTAIGEETDQHFDLTPEKALSMYNARDNKRSQIWRDHFG